VSIEVLLLVDAEEVEVLDNELKELVEVLDDELKELVREDLVLDWDVLKVCQYCFVKKNEWWSYVDEELDCVCELELSLVVVSVVVDDTEEVVVVVDCRTIVSDGKRIASGTYSDRRCGAGHA
jgi:hypothetical protein